jgi:porphobilinogen synthase
MAFPEHRFRRLRRTAALRALVRETSLEAGDLIAPLFVKESIAEPSPIPSMPGQWQHTIESLRKEAVEVAEQGVRSFVLFAVPERKDAEGSEAWNPAGIGQQAIAALRTEFGEDAVVMADLCLDEYTDHGHCGLLSPAGDVDNDATVERYRWIAVAQAEAGAHVVAPSGMMDGQVAAIREALDASGARDVAIMAYAAKFASALYAPFREAAEGAPKFGDRTGYQEDPANSDEALREILADVEQGADIVMVKPALPYLDIVRMAKDATGYPTAAYHVSGEYAMVKAAAANGWIDERRVVLELLTSVRRAGADLVLTYHAKDAAQWLRDRSGHPRT